jgi:hypothetical protein
MFKSSPISRAMILSDRKILQYRAEVFVLNGCSMLAQANRAFQGANLFSETENSSE